MYRGDISNSRSYAFGFRCEDSLFKRRLFKYSVDKEILSMMNYIYWNTEYTVILLMNKENERKFSHFLPDFPFNQVLIHSVSEITMMLNTGEITYYVDNCEKSRAEINSKYAITLNQLEEIVRKRYNRGI